MSALPGQLVSAVVAIFPPSFHSSGIRRILLPLLLLALIPLAFSVFDNRPSFSDKLNQTIDAHPGDPGLKKRIRHAREQQLPLDKFLGLLPQRRLHGALFPRDSQAYWLIALGTALAFVTVFHLVIPSVVRFRTLLFIALFTATVGIILLTTFQVIASDFAADNRWIVTLSPYELFYLLIKFIGYSYSAADDPQNGFFLSFFGFTFGVGVCEEPIKAFPILFVARSDGERDLSCKKLLLCGLTSGIGFGIAEGISYSTNFYNGVSGPIDYFVRFSSCVTLHGVWSGTVAVILYNRLLWLRDTPGWISYCLDVLLIVSIPVVLHGIYNTLLKQQHDLLALLTAVVSIFFLTYLIRVMHPKPRLG